MIYNKDCLEAMKEMSDNQFDLAIVDPPYGIGISGQKEKNKAKKVTENIIKKKTGTLKFLIKNIFKSCKELVKIK